MRAKTSWQRAFYSQASGIEPCQGENVKVLNSDTQGDFEVAVVPTKFGGTIVHLCRVDTIRADKGACRSSTFVRLAFALEERRLTASPRAGIARGPTPTSAVGGVFGVPTLGRSL